MVCFTAAPSPSAVDGGYDRSVAPIEPQPVEGGA